MSTSFTADVWREGRMWVGAVRGMDGATTDASSLPGLLQALAEVIVLQADLPDSAVADVATEITLAIKSNRAAKAALADLERTRNAAAHLSEATAAAYQALVASVGPLSVRDAAVALNLSPQRISQIAHSIAAGAKQPAPKAPPKKVTKRRSRVDA